MDKNKKATINLFNRKDKCFQDAVTVTLNHEEIKQDLQRITKIKRFIKKYNYWKRINFPLENKGWKQLEKNNPAIAFNVLYAKKEKIYPAYVSKHSNRVKQVLLLMKLNRKGWHSLAVTKLSVLLREITSKQYYNLINIKNLMKHH